MLKVEVIYGAATATVIEVSPLFAIRFANWTKIGETEAR